MKKIINRLHRMQGQLEGIERSFVGQHTCEDLIPQLLAVRGSLDSLIHAYLEDSLDSCLELQKTESIRNLIKTLIKYT